jgi:type II secretory pathway pseudopilin PulG
MGPVAWTVVGVLAALASGGTCGWLARGARADKDLTALQAQHAAADAERRAEAQQALLAMAEQLGKPVTLDAETRAALARTPPACLPATGGDPDSPACVMLSCWSYGQSAAQRPECSELQREALAVLAESWRADLQATQPQPAPEDTTP